MTLSLDEVQLRARAIAYARQHKRERPSLTPAEFFAQWRFKNRETGQVETLGDSLFDSQQRYIEAAEEHPWVFVLKAGKLGATELACAYDAYHLLYRGPNTRVHVFSMGLNEAKELKNWIAFGLERLPPALRMPILPEPGSDTTTRIRLQAGLDDIRTLVVYPSGPHTSIDQTAHHTHVDELARMRFPERTWPAIESTIADVPDATCHIVTRGAGADNYAAVIWLKAIMGDSRLHPLFVPWHARPGRDQAWFDQQQRELDAMEHGFFAPSTAEDAIAGASAATVIPMAWAEEALQRVPWVSQGAGTIAAGLDVARYGHDKTALIIGSDTDIFALDEWQGLPLTATAEKVLTYIEDHEIDVLAVDDTGVGGGVTDILAQHEGFELVPVNFGERARDPTLFHDRVSEIWWGMREALDPAGPQPLSLPGHHQLALKLATQTQARRYKYDHTGVGRKWVYRDEREGEAIPSPDMADALALMLEAWRVYHSRVRRHTTYHTSGFMGRAVNGAR